MLNSEKESGPANANDERDYALGYTETEFERLQSQGRFFRDLMEDLLRRAGIASGMHVLDVGCGVGDVSLLAAELVGPSGGVLGIDRSTEAVNVAHIRAVRARQHWVRFYSTELDEFATEENFGAIVGRLILLYLSNPAATLRRLSRNLRPGGILVFQEMIMPLVRSNPDGKHFHQCLAWIIETFGRAGAEVDMGSKLFATFLSAGLPPQMILAGRVEGGPDSPIYGWLAGVLRSLLPMAERLNVATAVEVQIETIAERMRNEAVQENACIMAAPFIGAWTQLSA